MRPGSDHPHGGARLHHAGAAVAAARVVAIVLHGRGATADGILSLAHELTAADVAYLAPQAAGHAWYPYSFLSPLERNEPWLGSALRLLSELVASLQEQGVAPERVALMGFSQGACLATEFAARHPRRYACVAAFSGGLIGPPGVSPSYQGTLDGTPAFFGCSDTDPHIPLERVRESAAIYRRMGAVVDERIYPGMGHTIIGDEIAAVGTLLAQAGR